MSAARSRGGSIGDGGQARAIGRRSAHRAVDGGAVDVAHRSPLGTRLRDTEAALGAGAREADKASARVLVFDEAPIRRVRELMQSATRVGQRFQQSAAVVGERHGFSRGVRGARQVAVRAECQRGDLPTGRDKRNRRSAGIALDRGHVAIGVRDRGQPAVGVVAEAVDDDAGLGIDGPEMAAILVEDKRLRSVLRSDEEFGARKSGQWRRDALDTIEIEEVDRAIRTGRQITHRPQRNGGGRYVLRNDRAAAGEGARVALHVVRHDGPARVDVEVFVGVDNDRGAVEPGPGGVGQKRSSKLNASKPLSGRTPVIRIEDNRRL